MIRIALEGDFDAGVSSDLQALEESLTENGVSVSSTTITVPGVKVGLVIALAIASLTVASISTLINVINFWKSQRPTAYRISLETKAGVVPLDAAAAAALTQAVEQGEVVSLKIVKI